jgi:hypothetical protein
MFKFANGDNVPTKLITKYQKALAKADKTGVSQSLVSLKHNGIEKTISISHSDIDAVASIVSQIGGRYHGSIIVIK